MVKEELGKYKGELALYLQEYFDQSPTRADTMDTFIAEYVMRGGKRLRPALFYYSYLIFSNENLEEVKKLSMLFEFVQSFFLIHDDIMDRDAMRRGGLTVHKMYEKVAEEMKIDDKEHYGVSLAILAGDLSAMRIFEILSKSKISDSSKVKLMEFFAHELSITIYGQAKDINIEHAQVYTQADIEEVQLEKTAVYTFESPVLAGAILGGATEVELDILSKYSISAGIAFQTRDDILGVFGDAEETGKSNAGDIAEGKRTLLILKAYENATEEQKELLCQFLGNKNLTDQDLEVVRDIIRDSGSLAYSIELCKSKVEEANSYLSALERGSEIGKKFLREIAEYMIVRDI